MVPLFNVYINYHKNQKYIGMINKILLILISGLIIENIFRIKHKLILVLVKNIIITNKYINTKILTFHINSMISLMNVYINRKKIF